MARMWKKIHGRIFLLTEDVWVHKTIILPPLFIEAHVRIPL